MKIKKLTVIVPVFNEEGTVAQVIERLSRLSLGKIKKEIIIVDDGSTDASASVIENLKFRIENLKLIKHKINEGKGAAIESALKIDTGDFVIIQDADLEYDPREIKKLVIEAEKTNSDVIFGTRNKGIINDYAYPVFFWGAKILILMINLFYHQNLTDPECCYKLIKRDLLDFEITEKGFGVEVELTAKLAKKGIKIKEVPIRYNPRTFREGKKIRAADGVAAVWLALKWAV